MHKVLYSNRLIDTSRLPSPSIWKNYPGETKPAGQVIDFFDDFVDWPLTPTITTTIGVGKYKAFGSSGATMTDSDEVGGVLKITEATDNEGASIQQFMLPYQISASHFGLWFETRIKLGAVADTDCGVFVGLLDQATISATVPIAAAGTLADQNFIGFHRLEGDGDQIDVVYKADGQTQQSLITDAISTTANVHTVAGALAADTFIKLGFVHDPNAEASKRIKFFINGVELTTYVTQTLMDAATFPDDVRLGLCIAMLSAASATGVVEIDWWKCGQLLVA